MVRTGANIVIESLCRNGTETLFGYPGGAVLPIYEELYRNSSHAVFGLDAEWLLHGEPL